MRLLEIPQAARLSWLAAPSVQLAAALRLLRLEQADSCSVASQGRTSPQRTLFLARAPYAPRPTVEVEAVPQLAVEVAVALLAEALRLAAELRVPLRAEVLRPAAELVVPLRAEALQRAARAAYCNTSCATRVARFPAPSD